MMISDEEGLLNQEGTYYILLIDALGGRALPRLSGGNDDTRRADGAKGHDARVLKA
jgi:hypothetical protein